MLTFGNLIPLLLAQTGLCVNCKDLALRQYSPVNGFAYIVFHYTKATYDRCIANGAGHAD